MYLNGESKIKGCIGRNHWVVLSCFIKKNQQMLEADCFFTENRTQAPALFLLLFHCCKFFSGSTKSRYKNQSDYGMPSKEQTPPKYKDRNHILKE